jgi:hypothetical protein
MSSGAFSFEERRQPVDDLAVVLGALDGVEEGLLAGAGDVK